MKRVAVGEPYFHVSIGPDGKAYVDHDVERVSHDVKFTFLSSNRLISGNYFDNPDDAESISRHINALFDARCS
jgi:hypothetical protein